jgi:hypothetical protein
MTLRKTIQDLISQYYDEIVSDGDWFYALDHYEVNVHDWDEDGVFEVQVYPREGCVTDWSRIIHLPTLNFSHNVESKQLTSE